MNLGLIRRQVKIKTEALQACGWIRDRKMQKILGKLDRTLATGGAMTLGCIEKWQNLHKFFRRLGFNSIIFSSYLNYFDEKLHNNMI